MEISTFTQPNDVKNSSASSIRIVANISQCGSWLATNFLGKVAGENANKLWTLVRAIDKQGSGKAYLNLKIAADLLGITIRQVRRYVQDGLKLGFFRSIHKIHAGIVLVYYSSTIKVAQNLGLDELGAIADIPIAGLKDLRQYASKIVVLANQRASEFRQKSKKLPGTILDPEKALKPCGIASRAILWRTPRYLIVRADTQLVGGSQSTAAKKLGRSVVTINSHLRGLNWLQKKQIAIADRANWLEVGRNALEHKPNLGLFKLEDFPVPLKSYCCIYSIPEIELVPQKYLRQKLKIALRQTKDKAKTILQGVTTLTIFGGEDL